jgi:hypothetical protein
MIRERCCRIARISVIDCHRGYQDNFMYFSPAGDEELGKLALLRVDVVQERLLTSTSTDSTKHTSCYHPPRTYHTPDRS